MTITSADIQLIESERMADTTDGGGRRTARVIPDGTAGNIFPKVSRLDSVYGRVNLRKVFGAINTANVDTYGGAHAIITDPPDNARIHCCLFTTGSDFDQRTSARDRIESYVVYGPESRLRLFGRQPPGAKAVLAYQRTSEPLPEVGQVLALVQEAENNPGTTLAVQYIRVDSVTATPRDFEDDKGVYTYQVITVGITSPLTFAFYGPDTPQRNSGFTRYGKIRETSVADAARYFGVQPLASAALAGDLTLKVPSVYTAIVPTTQREAAISLASIAGADNYIAAGATFVDNVANFAGGSYQFPGSIRPGSVSIAFTGGGGWSAVDDGAGALQFTAAGLALGTVDYDTGLVTISNAPAGTPTKTAAHAVPVSQPAHTRDIPVTLANRGSVYSVVLSPAPAPGTLIVDYRALGKWYRLRDETSRGTLAGADPRYGTGTVSYVDGGVVVTLGALPDIGSSVLLSWGSAVHYVTRTEDASPWLAQNFQLAHTPVTGDVSVSFQYGNTFNYTLTTKTFVITGATYTEDMGGTGFLIAATLNRATGLLSIEWQQGAAASSATPGGLPGGVSATGAAIGRMISVAYGQPVATAGSAQPVRREQSFSLSAGLASLSLGQAVKPGSVYYTLPLTCAGLSDGTTTGPALSGSVDLRDDGNGRMVKAPSVSHFGDSAAVTLYANGGNSGATDPGAQFGAINYSTGVITLGFTVVVTGRVWQQPLGLRPGAWVAASGTAAPALGRTPNESVTVDFQPTGSTTTVSQYTEDFSFDQAPFGFDLTRTTGEAVVPGSVVFRLESVANGSSFQTYYDRAGQIITYVSQLTQAGAVDAVGDIDYSTGRVRLHTLPLGAYSFRSKPLVASCVTARGQFSARSVRFRTAGSPVRPGSLYVQATGTDGVALSGTANNSGVITGTNVTGTVNQDMGVVSVDFGVDILPATLRYSAVVTSNVALDTSILGLDPVRLPIDGLVPIFRPGDVAVIHNTQSFTLPSPAGAGATYSVGRSGLSDLWLTSAAGVRIDPTLYSVNLASGNVTMATPLSLAGIAQPLVARHRVEDMLLLADVQIDGRLSSAGTLSRDYATAGTYVSSALLFGDLSARVTNVFDLATWAGVWAANASASSGAGATAQYNDVLYPIEVTNAGALTERWRLQFTGTTTFSVIGENSGVISTGSTSADCAPINPLTSLPYFVVRAGGWGAGWSVGNQLRFDTVGAAAPIWMARTILPGATLAGDSIDVQLRGDVDA